MCGRYALTEDTNEFLTELVEEHGIQALGHWQDYVPQYNIKPTNTVPVILHGKREDATVITSARWSLVAPWAKDLSTRFPTFNARSEGITEKRTWKGPVKASRCLIPASGYVEWVGDKAPKTPHWIRPTETSTLMFAGLYSWWADPSLPEDDDDRWLLTTTILTMATVPELADIHDRNPMALPESHWDSWIDPNIEGDQALVDDAVAASRTVMSELTSYVIRPIPGRGAVGAEMLLPA